MTSLQQFIIAVLILSVSFVSIYSCCVSLPPVPTYRIDYPKSQELFLKCLESVPAGPTHTKYNDWDEIVESCRQTSISLGKKCIRNCP